MMKFYEKEMKLSGKIHYSKQPLNQFTRQILIQMSSKHIEDPLNSLLNKLKNSGELAKLFKKYGLQNVQNGSDLSD